MTGTSTRRDQAEAKAALNARLVQALAEAREAAESAVAAYLLRYPRQPKEHYEFGGAVLLARSPTPQFRRALSALDATERWPTGSPPSWEIKTGYRNPRGIGGTRDLSEVAAKAGAGVMASKFPDEDFWVHTWVD